MKFKELSDHRRLQVEMAAKGCVSGMLSEWPALYRALESLGYPVNITTHTLEAKEWAREVIEREKK